MNDVFVEAAPESVDLDALLGLSDVDLDAGTSVNIEVMSDDNVPVDEPHIKVPVKKLIGVLKVSSMISAAGENSFEGKVVVMKIEDGFKLHGEMVEIGHSIKTQLSDNTIDCILRFIDYVELVREIVEQEEKDEKN